jgi:hypothetical protein
MNYAFHYTATGFNVKQSLLPAMLPNVKQCISLAYYASKREEKHYTCWQCFETWRKVLHVLAMLRNVKKSITLAAYASKCKEKHYSCWICFEMWSKALHLLEILRNMKKSMTLAGYASKREAKHYSWIKYLAFQSASWIYFACVICTNCVGKANDWKSYLPVGEHCSST